MRPRFPGTRRGPKGDAPHRASHPLKDLKGGGGKKLAIAKRERKRLSTLVKKTASDVKARRRNRWANAGSKKGGGPENPSSESVNANKGRLLSLKTGLSNREKTERDSVPHLLLGLLPPRARGKKRKKESDSAEHKGGVS